MRGKQTSHQNHVFVSECGRPIMTNRIVGGSSALEGAWPWQVDIQVRMAGIMKG